MTLATSSSRPFSVTGPAVANPGNPADAGDAGGGKIARTGADQRHALAVHPASEPAAQRRPHCQDAVEHAPNHHADQQLAAEPAPDAERHLAHVAAGQIDRRGPVRDRLRSRRRSFRRRPAAPDRPEVDPGFDTSRECICNGRGSAPLRIPGGAALVARRGDHDLVRHVASPPGLDDEATALSAEPFDAAFR